MKDHWDASLNESGEAVLGHRDEAQLTVAPAPTSGGAAVVVSGRY